MVLQTIKISFVKILNLQLSVFVVTLLLVALQGCYRGESRSVDEIYTTALQQFHQHNLLTVEAKARTPLKNLDKNLTALAQTDSTSDIVKISQEVIDSLRALIPGAGYTSRPALNEIVDQYFNLIGSAKLDSLTLNYQDKKTLKLLAARTLFVLDSELNAIAFKLFDRETKAG
jgi:hypothetical protein